MKKVHLGSGPNYAEGWINLDLNNYDGWAKQPDILASVFDMPFEDGSVDRFYCGHLLEHLEWQWGVPRALKEIKRCMSDEAVLCVVGPCIEKAVRTGQPQWLLDEIPRGWDSEGEPEGFPHLWTATTLLTRIALERVFDPRQVEEVCITTILEPDWPELAPAFPPLVGMWQCAFEVRL